MIAVTASRAIDCNDGDGRPGKGLSGAPLAELSSVFIIRSTSGHEVWNVRAIDCKLRGMLQQGY
jgi:hypothetical protein